MPFGRFLVTTKASAASAPDTSFTNTLYFNISPVGPDPTDWQGLVDDLHAALATRAWNVGRWLDVRAYDMDDAEPRPIKARKSAQNNGVAPQGVPQVALALSYYADRNLPRQRGRIYLGPWSTGSVRPDASQLSNAIAVAQAFADLGGANVDWSLYSPTNGTHTRISNAWVDDSWDIIRSRKIAGTSRVTWSGDG